MKLFKSKQDPLLDKRLLPTGMKAFEEWSDRIIALTNLEATPESQKFALATMITTLPKTECDKEDLYFVKALHKGAADQIAGAQMEQIRTRVKARLLQEEADRKQASESASSIVVTPQVGDNAVLEAGKV